MKKLMLAVCLIFAVVLHQPARGDTPLDIIGLEKSINDAARRAQETGDHIAQTFANQALKVIAEWKKANADLIGKTFDELDNQTRAVFNELNNTAIRIERGEAVAFIDIQKSLANAGSALSVIPGAFREPQVTFYWPTVILPSGEASIAIKVVGFRLADAEPRARKDGTELPVKRSSDNEILIVMDRATLPFDEQEARSVTVSLDYQLGTFRWYSPLTWFSDDTRTRDLELRLLPKVPGSVSIRPTITTETWETKVTGPETVGGRGRDNAYRATVTVPPALQEAGWILDKDAQANAHFDDNGGDGNGGSSCNGYDARTFTDTSFVFVLTHGHVTRLGRKSDARQNCRVWTHLKRKMVQNQVGDSVHQQLDWLQDREVPLPENTTSSTMTLQLYDGRQFEITDNKDVPYSLFEIFHAPGSVKFRPRPQRDF